MCEPWIVEKTGLSVAEHQARTVAFTDQGCERSCGPVEGLGGPCRSGLPIGQTGSVMLQKVSDLLLSSADVNLA
jgi:hypothetical protein